MTQKIFGNWVYEQILGSGGFGQVELWKHKYTNKRIAIKKCILLNTNEKPRQMQRWKKEIENMNNFKHPNIVKAEPLPSEMIFELPVLCMEFCNKGDLRKLLNKPENACGLIQSELMSVMKDISSALKYLHYNKITHRDLKPENIVLHEKSGMVVYKLIDLGYAKELGNVTMTASLVGTFNYVAPEFFWKQKYTCSVDYWSLGILFFEVLTGYKPFLPYIDKIIQWLKYIENKAYEHICAKEIKGNVQFFNYIAYPNDLSECALNKMSEWFQIALQWDPRQRGKRQGSDELVVFSLLKEIFPLKTIYIFTVPLYRMDQFNITSSTNFTEMQKWIEQKTSIPPNEQIIADTTGNILNIKTFDKSALSNNSEVILYVYKNDCLEVKNLDGDWKMPEILDLMLVNPEEIKERSLLKQCYTALIYTMRHEVMLFKQYTLALCTKLDIINTRLSLLNKNIQQSLPNAEVLLNKVKNSLKLMNSDGVSNEVAISINGLFHKIQRIYDTIKNIKIEAERCDVQMKEFFDSEKLLYNLQKYTKIYEDCLQTYCTFESEKIYSSDNIDTHVNKLIQTLSEFEEQKMMQLQDPEIINIARKLVYYEKTLHTHLEVINSSMKLICLYESKFSESLDKIHQCVNVDHSTPHSDSSLLVNDDTEIRDNIVLRALFHKCFQDIQQNWSKLLETCSDDMM